MLSVLKAKTEFDYLMFWSKILDQWNLTEGGATWGCSWLGHFILFGEDMTACVCKCVQDRLWKTGSGIECPCLRTWKLSLIFAEMLMVDNDMPETVWSEQHENVWFGLFHPLSIQPPNGEPHSFYHQYPDCSGRSGGISLVLLLRVVLNLKGLVKPCTSVIHSFNTLHGLLTTSSQVK